MSDNGTDLHLKTKDCLNQTSSTVDFKECKAMSAQKIIELVSPVKEALTPC